MVSGIVRPGYIPTVLECMTVRGLTVKNLKPSKLPEGTVIDDAKWGEHIKRADGIWEELDSDYMGDRYRVTDSGYDKDGDESYVEFLRRTSRADSTKSDDYFTDYKIIAVPPEFVFVGDAESIHGPMSKWFGVYSDGTRKHDCKGYNCEF
jgi:hypothetical protein